MSISNSHSLLQVNFHSPQSEWVTINHKPIVKGVWKDVRSYDKGIPIKHINVMPFFAIQDVKMEWSRGITTALRQADDGCQETWSSLKVP